MRRMHGKPWDKIDLRFMKASARRKLSSKETAQLMGRTTAAVKWMAMQHSVRFHKIEQPRNAQRKRLRKAK